MNKKDDLGEKSFCGDDIQGTKAWQEKTSEKYAGYRHYVFGLGTNTSLKDIC